MDASVFQALRAIVFRESGIRLSDAKACLLAARVGKRLRALGLKSERQYLEVLRRDESGRELVEFLDVVSTNFTSFYREPDHFELLARQLEGWRRGGQQRFRLWCAAASTGEEPYTLAMVAGEALGPDADLRILATDLSTRALRTAVTGEYLEGRLAPVPPALRRRYFSPTGRHGPDGERWSALGSLRSRVRFARLNLATPPFPMTGPFDAIFCRNVMIYLAREVRQRLVDEAARLLRSGGLLFVGHAETLSGLCCGPLQLVVPSVYRKVA